MEKKKIGIAILATNSYFVLGIRLIKGFMRFYKGEQDIKFYFFSEIDPKEYVPDGINIRYYYASNSNWLDGTNSKFTSMLKIEKDEELDYLYYIDADTSITKDFIEDWFLGETVTLQHFGDQGWMKDIKGYDRNPISEAYIPLDTNLPQMYYHGAFMGGEAKKIFDICRILLSYQIKDKKIPYEPSVNDESYINKYFHYNPPTKVVLSVDYKFNVSDKSGVGNTRDMNLNITEIKNDLLINKDNNIDIVNGKVITY